MQLENWRPESGSCDAIDLSISVDALATGWTAALARVPKVVVSGEPLSAPPSPKTVSLAVGRQTLKTFGFTFPEAPGWSLTKPKDPEVAAQSGTPPAGENSVQPRTVTRLK